MTDRMETPRAAEPDAAVAEAIGAADVATAAAVTAASYRVVANVNVRSGPGTTYSKVGSLSAGSRVSIDCQTPGENVPGPLGPSNIWDRVGSGRYVSDAYIDTGTDGYVAPRC
ncbi:SH3 domain-containing protein [Streptomyces odontomachi]|uniref:SH3 domain-containing protein n=1 Tax=Streptomyces odontomachi TaxID=2944940 RepID=UPI0021091C68|nr:SH3 domain-containing protein [Streptomyces sp. ODS25]